MQVEDLDGNVLRLDSDQKQGANGETCTEIFAPAVRREMDARRRRLSRAVVACALGIGCEGSPSEPSESLDVPQPLVPLAVGTRWSYQITDSVEIGAWPALAPIRFNVRVIGDTLIDGQTWAVLDTAQLILHDNYAGRYYLTNRGNGTYETAARHPTLPYPPGIDLAFLLFPYPTRRGEAGSFTVVTSTDTSITVPAGTFRCLRYDKGPLTTFFVAPRVGIVKKVSGLIEGSGPSGFVRVRLVYQLTSFEAPDQ